MVERYPFDNFLHFHQISEELILNTKLFPLYFHFGPTFMPLYAYDLHIENCQLFETCKKTSLTFLALHVVLQITIVKAWVK